MGRYIHFFCFLLLDVAGIDRTKVPPTLGGDPGSAGNQFSSLNTHFLGCAGYFVRPPDVQSLKGGGSSKGGLSPPPLRANLLSPTPYKSF